MKLEKEVKKEIYKKLDLLEFTGDILWYERLQSGAIHNGNQHVWLCRPGTPDFEVVMKNKQGNLSVIFIEVKREGVFESRKGVQREWQEKYSGLHIDLKYVVAQSVEDMMKVINEIAVDSVSEIIFNP